MFSLNLTISFLTQKRITALANQWSIYFGDDARYTHPTQGDDHDRLAVMTEVRQYTRPWKELMNYLCLSMTLVLFSLYGWIRVNLENISLTSVPISCPGALWSGAKMDKLLWSWNQVFTSSKFRSEWICGTGHNNTGSSPIGANHFQARK